MQRLLTEVEKAEIIEREWAKARARNPKVVMRVTVQDETDEGGRPRVNVVIAFKRLELLGELASASAPVAVLINPKAEYAEQQAKDLQEGAHRIGRQILILNASSERDIDNAFRTLIARQAAGLLVAADPFFLNRREQLIALASYHGIPAIYEWREYALAGGLMTYGTSITDSYRQAGVYVGRILKGEKPIDLPVMQPTKFELVINLKTAKALGLTIPDKLLALADEVIE
jgi:putative tryptophan/tyrosine transport system substrate-binding protein